MASEPIVLEQPEEARARMTLGTAVPRVEQPQPQSDAAPEPKPESQTRINRRIGTLVRRNHELAEVADNWERRHDEVVRHGNRLAQENAELKAENARLEQALARALDLRDQYRERLKQRLQQPPITPALMQAKGKP